MTAFQINDSTNYTTDETPVDPGRGGWAPPAQITVGAVVGLVNLVTILGNLSVVYAFGRSAGLRSCNNYYIVSLAVADLIVGLTTMPMYGLYWLLGYWPLGHTVCTCHLVISHCILNTTFLSVLVIAADRFMSITYPIAHLQYRTKKCALLLISLTYLVPVLIWVPFILSWQFAYDGPFTVQDYRCYPLYLSSLAYTTASVLVLNWIPMFAVTVVYVKVYRSVRGKIARRLQRLRAIREAACRNEAVQREESSAYCPCDTSSVDAAHRMPLQDRGLQRTSRVFVHLHCGAMCGVVIASDSRSSDDYRPPSSSAAQQQQSDSASCLTRIGRSVEGSSSSSGLSGATTRRCCCPRRGDGPRSWRSYRRSPRGRSRMMLKEERNLALRTLSLIFVSMLVSGLPWAITALVIVICRYCIPFFVQQMLVFLVHTSSTVNPFCYAAANPLYRKAFLKFLNLRYKYNKGTGE